MSNMPQPWQRGKRDSLAQTSGAIQKVKKEEKHKNGKGKERGGYILSTPSPLRPVIYSGKAAGRKNTSKLTGGGKKSSRKKRDR